MTMRLMRQKVAAALAAALLVAGIIPAVANQANTWSPTTGTVSGLQLTTNYNNAFSAIQSCNSGAASPTNDQTAAPVQGQCWLNTGTTPFTVQMYDSAQWITVGWLDTVNHLWIINTGGGIGSVASASTTDLCATGGVLTPNPTITISGSASINGFGTTCPTGTFKLVSFSGTPTLVNNATSFVLPNAGFNINVNAGDSLAAVVTSPGNWKVVTYQQVNGTGGIPSGTEAPFAGVVAPSGWTLEAGQAISRSANPNLFNAITVTVTGTPGNGSAVINSVSTNLTNLGVEGALVEGTGIPIGNFISSVTATTITMNTTATGGSGGQTIRILPWGQGDASTTFNVPDRRGVVLAGRDNMLGTAAGRLSLAQSQGILGTKFGAGAAGGNIGGEQGHTPVLSELFAHSHTATSTVTDPGHVHSTTAFFTNNTLTIGLFGGGSNVGSVGTSTIGSSTTGITVGTTTASVGSSTPFNQVQPTAIANYMIKN